MVVALLRNKPAIVRERLRGVVSDGGLIIISSIVLFELWYGVACSERRQENTERLRVFLSGISTSDLFEEGDALIAGDLARHTGKERYIDRSIRPVDRCPGLGRVRNLSPRTWGVRLC